MNSACYKICHLFVIQCHKTVQSNVTLHYNSCMISRFALIGFLLFAISAAHAAPTQRETPDAMARGTADNTISLGALNVRDFGARGDAKTDDTAAFQAALDAASTRSSVVFAPAGQYRLNGTLTVPTGVTLEGSWRGPHTSQLSIGTTLLAYAGRGDENAAPFVSLLANSTIKGVTIYYPEQRITAPDDSAPPVLDMTAARHWILPLGKNADAPWLRGDWFQREGGNIEFPEVPGATKRWSGARPTILLPLTPGREYSLRVFLSVPPQSLRNGATHTVKLNGRVIGTLSKSGEQTFQTKVPAALIGDKKLAELSFEINTWKPSEGGASTDTRDLGIAVRAVEIIAAGSENVPVVEASTPPIEIGVVPYPWTIQGRGQQFNVLDTTIINAWNGIDCGTFHNEGHHLRNVMMCALRRGVNVDQTTDIGRLENVHIHSVFWWRANPPGTPLEAQRNYLSSPQILALNQYTRENLEGFVFGRCDWEYVSNSFVIWAKVGLVFHRTTTPSGGVPNVVMTQSGSDEGPLAARIEETQPHSGIAFENCQFMSGVEIGPRNTGDVKFANCGFWGMPASGSQLIAEGSGTVALANCHFSEWEAHQPCIDAHAGSLLISTSDFLLPGTQIRLGADVKSAAILGNRFRAGKNIENNSKGDVQLSANVAQ